MRKYLAIFFGAMFLISPSDGAATKKKKSRASKPAAVSRQAAPSALRYQEIQEALIAKGYLQGPATGTWDQNSVDAMRRFQTDQKLDPTGKLNSRSLISLGLGPQEPPNK